MSPRRPDCGSSAVAAHPSAMSGLAVAANGDRVDDVPSWLIDVLSSTEGISDSVANGAGSSDQIAGEQQGCWGAQLKGNPDGCTKGFTAGKNHFKNKFCARCRECIDVPAARVRALTDEQADQAFNQLASGFWKRAPASLGSCMVRVTNQTHSCHGPVLCVFRDVPPIGLAEVPTKWVSGLTTELPTVRFSVSKGTLVPALQVSRRPLNFGLPRMGSKRQRHGEPDREEPSLGTGLSAAVSTHHHSSGDDSEMAEGFTEFAAALTAWSNGANECSSVALPLPSAEAQPLTPLCDGLESSHAATISRIEKTLATETTLSEPIRALLQRQLEDARRAQHEIRLLAAQIARTASVATATEGLSVSAATISKVSSVSPARGRRTSAATWNNLAVVSELAEEDSRPCPTSWQPPEHYSSTLQRYSRGQSDATLQSPRTRIQSLSRLFRRLFRGAPGGRSNGASVQAVSVGEADSDSG